MDGLILPVGKGCNLPVGLFGLIRLPGLLLHGGKTHQRGAMVRVDRERLAELLFRLRRFALRQIEPAQIDPGFRRFRRLGGGLLEHLLGARDIFTRQLDLCQGNGGLQMAGRLPESLLQMRFRAFGLSQSQFRERQNV